MSTRYVSRVVFGFMVNINTKTKEIKKYDENTGEAYMATVNTHEVATIDGVDVHFVTDDPDALVDGERIDGLEYGSSGYENGNKWLGVVVATVDDNIPFEPLSLAPPVSVLDFAEKYNIKPFWFMSMYIG